MEWDAVTLLLGPGGALVALAIAVWALWTRVRQLETLLDAEKDARLDDQRQAAKAMIALTERSVLTLERMSDRPCLAGVRRELPTLTEIQV